ncbi:MAG TPA: mechanosensitive ion channel family protein [Sphingomonadaceae bacterium]
MPTTKRTTALAKLLLALMVVQVPTGAAFAQALPLPTSSASAPASSEAPIPLRSPDAKIRSRLASLYKEVDGLGDVHITVHDGVVTLEGTALEPAASAKAEDIANRVDGVVSVDNRLKVEHRVDRRLEPVIAKSRQMVSDTITFLPLLAVALIVLIGFWMMGRFVTRNSRVFKQLTPNLFIATLLEQLVRVLFILVGLVLAMSILGATALLGSVLGAAGVIGLAVGFAVRDTIENYIASILLSVRRPFAPNDVVSIEGFVGKVALLNSRATNLILGDGTQVRIPNATVYKAIITNLSRFPERRFDFEIPIGFENDIGCALATALGAVTKVDGVLETPRPTALVDRIVEYSVVIIVTGWIDQTKSDFGKAKSEAIRRVKEALDAAHISIPEPIRAVRNLPDAPAVDRSVQAAKPSAAERAEINDTGVDTTLDAKVEQARAASGEDLLTTAAPHE